jgi:hypothetical protein
MTIFTFMSENPWLSFGIILLICLTIDSVVANICKSKMKNEEEQKEEDETDYIGEP